MPGNDAICVIKKEPTLPTLPTPELGVGSAGSVR
jgi:hypothetical protein